MEKADIWTRIENQGGQKLYTLQTRNRKAARAMRCGVELLHEIEKLIAREELEASNAGQEKTPWLDSARAVVAKAGAV